MELPLYFSYAAFLVGHNIDVSSESVSFELGFSDCFLLRIEIPLFGQKKNRFPLSVLRRLNCNCEFASIFVSIESILEFRISNNEPESNIQTHYHFEEPAKW